MASKNSEYIPLEFFEQGIGKKSASKGKKRGLSQKYNLSNFGIRNQGLVGSFANTGEYSGTSEFESVSKQQSLFNYIYAKLERQLIYPPELRVKGIEGIVTAEIFFTPDGKYLTQDTKVKSVSDYLRVYINQILRITFRHPLPKEYRKANKIQRIYMQFRFEFTEHDLPSVIAAKKYIRGNELYFYRNYPRSALEWEIGPIHGFGLFAVAADLLWPFEKVKDLLDRKVKKDPLETYREDPAW